MYVTFSYYDFRSSLTLSLCVYRCLCTNSFIVADIIAATNIIPSYNLTIFLHLLLFFLRPIYMFLTIVQMKCKPFWRGHCYSSAFSFTFSIWFYLFIYLFYMFMFYIYIDVIEILYLRFVFISFSWLFVSLKFSYHFTRIVMLNTICAKKNPFL